MTVGIAMGALGLIQGIVGANAASDAASAQVDAANAATDRQYQMFQQARQDQLPWMTRGNQAGNLLSFYLGLPGSDASGGTGAAPGMPPPPTLQQFTSTPAHTSGGSPPWATPPDPYQYRPTDYSGYVSPSHGAPAAAPVVDQAGYQKALAAWNAQNQSAWDKLKADPRFGSLLTPFTGKDLASEPGYQFGLKQGNESVLNNRAALGSILSGNTLRAVNQFGQDYAGTKYNEAFSRDQANKAFTNNVLAGMSGTGQVASSNIGSQTVNTGQQIGQNIIGAGNARASGYVGGANALNAGASNAYGNWLSYNVLRDVMPGLGGSSGSYGPAQPINTAGMSQYYAQPDQVPT
jgi:hypothetical protein